MSEQILSALCLFGWFVVITGGLVLFIVYKFISLPVITNLIYIHYGAKVVGGVIKEIKAPSAPVLPPLVPLRENVQ